ncbi:MAG TPA: UvrD-helicase domain-containing protein, partial [Magnetospirillaceae bacterium]|nr:UvrD-helicase domain-containing protein [Magnetospirillaceae bacterium]
MTGYGGNALPDADQKRGVELRKNGAVSAGAGSGKTTVLVARYLDLVLRDGADVRDILVLTFTRKAAAEMYGRIHRELLASDEPRAGEQAARFSEAQISTLDAFCSLVLRPEAQEYGYPPDFRVDDAECLRIAEVQALSFLLERREDPALREIFARLGFVRAWKALFADTAARLWTPAAAPDIPAMLARQALAVRETVQAQADVVRQASRMAQDAAAGTSLKPGGKASAVLLALAGLPEGDLEPSEAAAALESVAELNFQGFGRTEFETRIKEAAARAREAARLILKASEAKRLAPLTGAVLGLLSELGERVRNAKRRARVMSFRDVATTAVNLLDCSCEIRSAWKRRFRYLMIDEFQDNDELQKKLLYLLAERMDRQEPGIPAAADLEPDKLFFVGDEKQSIYRFRGADVAVFRGLVEDFGDGPALRTNYRSEPGLVAFFNRLFERILAGAERPWEAR